MCSKRGKLFNIGWPELYKLSEVLIIFSTRICGTKELNVSWEYIYEGGVSELRKYGDSFDKAANKRKVIS